MRHYEIVFLVHPDQSEQVPAMAERYQNMVTESGGTVHRFEDWGRRQLAHPIHKAHKAHYALLNIECDHTVVADITSAFKFNDAVLRHLVIARDKAISEASPMAVAVEEEKVKERESQRRRDAKAAAESAMLAEQKAQAASSADTAPVKDDDGTNTGDSAAVLAPDGEPSTPGSDDSADSETVAHDAAAAAAEPENDAAVDAGASANSA